METKKIVCKVEVVSDDYINMNCLVHDSGIYESRRFKRNLIEYAIIESILNGESDLNLNSYITITIVTKPGSMLTTFTVATPDEVRIWYNSCKNVEQKI
jgi:hypothetical protein